MLVVFFNSFSTSTCFSLFVLIFLLRLNSLVSKSVFFTKSAYANLAAKLLAVKLLNSSAKSSPQTLSLNDEFLFF